MTTARELKHIHEVKAQVEVWVDRGYKDGPLTAGMDDHRAAELSDLDMAQGGPFRWRDLVNMLTVLRSEYIEQLAADSSLGSNPLIQKLHLVDSVAANVTPS